MKFTIKKTDLVVAQVFQHGKSLAKIVGTEFKNLQDLKKQALGLLPYEYKGKKVFIEIYNCTKEQEKFLACFNW